ALTDQVGVEAAAQPAVARHHDQVDPLLLAASQERMRLLGEPGHDVGEHLRQLRGVRPRALGGFLGAAQPGSGPHLHRLGDLLRGSDGRDPLAEVLEAGHQAVKRLANSLNAASIFDTTSSVSSRLSRMAVSTSGCLESRKAYKSRS